MIKRIGRKFKKISWTKGATFLEFAVVGVMLLLILLVVVGLFLKRFTVERCDMYADAIARDVITCESMEDAVNKANEELSYFDIPFVLPEQPRIGTVVTQSGGLNVRGKPSIMAPVVGRLERGQRVTVWGTWNDWYVIESGNLAGYVARQFIQF